ncbi:hypothetical protein DFH11DRAFT_179188 [Phellopilus nigrolimitatus]|nr:hypothetical protein DFH11DRAFT_179188 [Phellopilus nigrolimitatus]
MSALSPIASPVAPVSGNNYTIKALRFSHWLDDSGSLTHDGNPILAWAQNVPTTANQVWTYLTYPSDNGDTVFTLQVTSTLNQEATFGGRGGYVRVDTATNRLVQGGAPQAWKLVNSTQPGSYKLVPFDDLISQNGTLVATDVNALSQVTLLPDSSKTQQFWSFYLNNDLS